MSPSPQMIQTIKELRCKRASALLATSLYHIRPHLAGNEGRHGTALWAGKRIAGRKVGRSWRPESFLNENKAV